MEAEETLDAVYYPRRKPSGGLPYGCISDKVISGIHHIYWNPIRNPYLTGSLDPNLQNVCRVFPNPEDITNYPIPGNFHMKSWLKV